MMECYSRDRVSNEFVEVLLFTFLFFSLKKLINRNILSQKSAQTTNLLRRGYGRFKMRIYAIFRILVQNTQKRVYFTSINLFFLRISYLFQETGEWRQVSTTFQKELVKMTYSFPKYSRIE